MSPYGICKKQAGIILAVGPEVACLARIVPLGWS
jgi:hypothetical protein